MADVTTLRIEINASGATATIDGVRRRIDGLSVSVSRAEAGLSRMSASFNTAFSRLNVTAAGLGASAGAAAAAVGGLSSAGIGAAAAMGGLAALLARVAPLAFAAGGALAAIGAQQGLQGLIATNSQYQNLRANLETVTGSAQRADAAFDTLQEFARTTPFQLNEVTQAFIRMRALGLETSLEVLRAFGNASAAFGTPFNQFVEAVADASVGEFERLREFGIRATRVGDQVAFTFRGQTQMIRNDSLEIQRFLRQLAEENFGGAMDRQAATIGGALSNLRDRFAELQARVGEAGFNQGFTNFIQSLERALGGLEGFADRAGQRLGTFFNNLATQIDNAGSTLDSFIVPFQVAQTLIGNALNGITQIVNAWAAELAPIFQAVFGSRFLRQVTEVFLAAGEIIFTIVRDWPRLLSTSLQSVLAVFTEFGRSVGQALQGNLTGAFDGFFERIDRGFTEQVQRTRQRVQEILQQAGQDVAAAGTEQGGGQLQRIVDDTRRQLQEAREAADRARAERDQARRALPEGGGGGGNSPRPDGTRSDPVSRDIFQQNNTSLERFTQDLQSLTQQYAPAIQRQREFNAAMQTLNLAMQLPAERLRDFGLTQQDLQQIMQGVNRSLGEQATLFGRLARELDIEIEQAVGRSQRALEALGSSGARGGSNVAERVGDRLASIIQQAESANEPLNTDQINSIRRTLTQLEEFRSRTEMTRELTRFRDQQEDTRASFGVFGRQRELAEQRQQAFRRLQEIAPNDQELNAAMESFDQALQRTEELREAQNTVVNGFRQATIEYAEQVKNVATETRNTIGTIIASLEDNLAEFIQTGRFNFRSFLQDMSRELARFAARRAIASAFDLFGLGGTGGFGGLGALFGGGRENGGPVGSNRAYLVGENGPELFLPRQSGMVMPMADMATRPSNDNRNTSLGVNVNLTGDGTGFDEGMIRRVMTDTMYAFQNELRFGGALR